MAALVLFLGSYSTFAKPEMNTIFYREPQNSTSMIIFTNPITLQTPIITEQNLKKETYPYLHSKNR